jgi:hypothetical protein
VAVLAVAVAEFMHGYDIEIEPSDWDADESADLGRRLATREHRVEFLLARLHPGPDSGGGTLNRRLPVMPADGSAVSRL